MKTQSENQIRAKNYLEKHGIEDIIADMINTITHVQMPDPIIFMIKFLAQLHSSVIQLSQAGIHLNNLQLITPVLCIALPQFPQTCKHQLQQSLDKEQFLRCKNNYTKEKNNLRQVLRISMEYPKSKYGLFLVDQDCYLAYEPIIRPIITKNTKNQDIVYERNQQLDQPYSCLSSISSYIEDCQIKMRRNLSGFMFNNSLNPSQRSQILNTISGWLSKSKYTTYEIDNIQIEEAKKIIQIHEKLLKRESANNLCNHLKGLKKGARYPDWPRNRAISISSDKSSLVWINKEDHLKYKSYSNKNTNLLDCLRNAFTFSEDFDKELISAHSERYGYLNVRPQDSGLGFGLSVKFKIDAKDSQQFKSNCKAMNNPFFSIKQQGKDNKWILQLEKLQQSYTSRICSLNRIDLYGELEKVVRHIFQGIFRFPPTVELQPLIEINPKTPSQLSSSSHVAINILTKNEEQEPEDQFKQFEPMEIEPDTGPQINFEKVDLNIYFDRLNDITKYLRKVCKMIIFSQKNFEMPELPFKPSKLALSLNDDVIYHFPTNKDLLLNRFYVSRRNLDHKATPEQANQHLRKFIDQQQIQVPQCFRLHQDFNIRDCREPTIKKNTISFMLQHCLPYGDFTLTHMYEPQIQKLQKDSNSKFYSSKSLKKQNDRITILTNQNDHYTIIYKIEQNSMSQAMEELTIFLEDFETFLKLRNLNFAEHPELGYLTSQVKYCGKGLSLVYQMPKKLNLESANLTLTSAMQCTQDDINHWQFLELIQITQESMRQYCTLINHLLMVDKKKGDIYPKDALFSRMDSIDQSPNVSSFTLYFQQYEIRLKTQLSSLQPNIMKMKSADTFDHELFDKILLSSKLRVPKKPCKATIKFVVSRNFDKYDYCQLLPLYDLQELKKKIENLLISHEMGFEKPSKSESIPEQIVNGFQHKTYRQIFINSCVNHHIQVFGSSRLQDLIMNLQRVSDILKKLQNAIQTFSKKDDLGYLGPIPNETLMSGIQFQIVLEVGDRKIKDISPICEEYKYEMVKCDNVFDEYINDDNNEDEDEQKPLLQVFNDDDNYDQMVWLYKLKSSRACHLQLEIDFLNKIF